MYVCMYNTNWLLSSGINTLIYLKFKSWNFSTLDIYLFCISGSALKDLNMLDVLSTMKAFLFA